MLASKDNSNASQLTSLLLASAGRLVSGHAAGYMLTLAISPLLARLYGPRAFGVYAVYVLVVSSLMVMATLRFDQAIPLAKRRRAATLLGLIAVSAMLSTVLGFMGCALVVCWWLNNPVTGTLVLLTANGVLCGGLYQIVAGLLLSERRYSDLAWMRVVFAVGSTLIHVFLPLSGASLILGLPAGQAAGFAMGAIFGCWRLPESRDFVRGFSRRAYLKLARQYRRFAQFGVPAAVTSNLGMHLPALLMALLYGLEAAGMYALAQRVFLSPLTLLTSAFSRVYLTEAGKLNDQCGLYPLFRSTITSAALLAAAPVTCVAMVAPWAFGWVFGPSWLETGWVCTLLAPMVLALALAYVVSPTFDVAQRQDQRLVRELLCTALLASGVIVTYLAGGSFFTAVAACSAGGTLGYSSLILGAEKYARRQLDGSPDLFASQQSRRAA